MLERKQALLAPGWLADSYFMSTSPLKVPQPLGELIALAIRESGLTQTATAAQLGVTPQAVGGWVKTGRIAKPMLAKLARLTGKPISFFLADAEQELTPAEAQLLELFRELPAVFQDKLLVHANGQWELAHPGRKSKAAPFAGVPKDQRKSSQPSNAAAAAMPAAATTRKPLPPGNFSE